MRTTVATLAEDLVRAFETEDSHPIMSEEARAAGDLAAELEGRLRHAPPQSLSDCLSLLAVAETICSDATVPISFEHALAGRRDVSRILRGVIAHLLATGVKTPLWPTHIDGMRFDDLGQPTH